ncbi:uncharacterized protein LOC111262491 isoform X2 [Varroa jacobsoni]|uniref:Uncharacterized protein n=1 Tax=Varroa destructor TaxID=109461 RepID=A0A7M7JJP1_VARDE|nr:uncharacterized protein LOC111246993 isoform X2 [Varroa destructor]XP_022692529.1 uncharacterized protein LOC111262491 isoform X2 [Varroa jacobsoni]
MASDDPVQALPTMALIDRFKGLNKRLIVIRDSLKERLQLQIKAFNEVHILRDQLRHQHAAYNQRIGQLAHLFEPITIASFKMQDAPEMLPLYERTGSVKDVNSEFGESDKQSDLCPAVLQFDLDEEDFDQVEGHSTASGSNSDKDIDQDRQFGQELFKEDKKIVRVEDELEMQVSANGGSVGHEIRPDESKQDAEYEYEPELIPEEDEDENDHGHDSGMSESSQTEMPMQSQPRTVVRYHILDEETHKIEEDQEAAECNESHRNDEDYFLVEQPQETSTHVVNALQRNPSPNRSVRPIGELQLSNELHLSAVLSTSGLGNRPSGMFESTRSTATCTDPQELLSPEIALSSPLADQTEIRELTFNRTMDASFLDEERSRSENLTNDLVPLASETIIRIPSLAPGQELRLVLMIRSDPEGIVNGKISCSKATPSDSQTPSTTPEET